MPEHPRLVMPECSHHVMPECLAQACRQAPGEPGYGISGIQWIIGEECWIPADCARE